MGSAHRIVVSKHAQKMLCAPDRWVHFGAAWLDSMAMQIPVGSGHMVQASITPLERQRSSRIPSHLLHSPPIPRTGMARHTSPSSCYIEREGCRVILLRGCGEGCRVIMPWGCEEIPCLSPTTTPSTRLSSQLYLQVGVVSRVWMAWGARQIFTYRAELSICATNHKSFRRARPDGLETEAAVNLCYYSKNQKGETGR